MGDMPRLAGNTGRQASQVGRPTAPDAEGTEHLPAGWAQGFPEPNLETGGSGQGPPRHVGCTREWKQSPGTGGIGGPREARTQCSLPELGRLLPSFPSHPMSGLRAPSGLFQTVSSRQSWGCPCEVLPCN